ncbi:hypothetical protein Tco_1066375 [Tanacetum coccineum]|uniref:Uncharacterized protein n=1 Tax=Tanacetum coccineum TaxID=301880 RepID=A0ABQ5HAA4_9ASTR
MDPSSSVGKTCLGENVIEISSDNAEGHRDWNSPKYLDTANSGGKKETKAMVFHKMETKENSDRFMAPCFFILNPEENDVEPVVVFGRSFLRLTKEIADFENQTVTIYLELDSFLDSTGEEEKIGDDWDLLLDNLDFGDILDIEGVDVPQFEEAEIKALAISICEIYSLLEEERPTIETMAYSDKYKKILDGICLDKMKLDEMNKEEKEAIIKFKGEALIEKKDLEAFTEGKYHECKKGDHDVKPLKGRAYRASERCSVPAKTSLDTTESDIDDEEEYVIQRNKFGAPIYRPKPASRGGASGWGYSQGGVRVGLWQKGVFVSTVNSRDSRGWGTGLCRSWVEQQGAFGLGLKQAKWAVVGLMREDSEGRVGLAKQRGNNEDIMYVPASPEHVPAIPNQLPVEPPLAPNPLKLDNDNLDAFDYDEEEDPKEDPEMDLDEEEEDPKIDVNDDEEEEEEPLPASPPPLSPLQTPPSVS